MSTIWTSPTQNRPGRPHLNFQNTREKRGESLANFFSICAELTHSLLRSTTKQSSPSSMVLAALLYAGGQRAGLSLWFQSVRMIVQRSYFGLTWVTNVVSWPIPDWGSWFTVAESAVVDLISPPSEFVLVLKFIHGRILGWPGTLGCISLRRPTCLRC